MRLIPALTTAALLAGLSTPAQAFFCFSFSFGNGNSPRFAANRLPPLPPIRGQRLPAPHPFLARPPGYRYPPLPPAIPAGITPPRPGL